MKGIILAAGNNTRMYPITRVMAKTILPVYDKPMINYPLTTLIEASIKDIAIIVHPWYEDSFKRYLGDGSDFGIHIEYFTQSVAKGIADAFLICEDFIGNDKVCLILGDNIFHSSRMKGILRLAQSFQNGGSIFGLSVADPRPFGVVEFDEFGKVISIEEKPENPKSNFIVPGLYFYDNDVVDIARHLIPSARGELEITDVNQEYLKRDQLVVTRLPEDTYWIDTGSPRALLQASQTIQKLQDEGSYVGIPEYVSYLMHFITADDLLKLGLKMRTTEYGCHLIDLAGGKLEL